MAGVLPPGFGLGVLPPGFGLGVCVPADEEYGCDRISLLQMGQIAPSFH
jgi:hypothetical protein